MAFAIPAVTSLIPAIAPYASQLLVMGGTALAGLAVQAIGATALEQAAQKVADVANPYLQQMLDKLKRENVIAFGSGKNEEAAKAPAKGSLEESIKKMQADYRPDPLFMQRYGDLVDEDDPPVVYSGVFAMQEGGQIPIWIPSQNIMPRNYDPSRTYDFQISASLDQWTPQPCDGQPGYGVVRHKECGSLGTPEVNYEGSVVKDGKEDPKFTAQYRERIHKLIDELNAKAQIEANRGLPCELVEKHLVSRLKVKSQKIYKQLEQEHQHEL